jgi:hypothetical protein
MMRWQRGSGAICACEGMNLEDDKSAMRIRIGADASNIFWLCTPA